MYRIYTMNNTFLYSTDGAVARSGTQRTGICLSVMVCARLGNLLTLSETHLLPLLTTSDKKVYNYINVHLSRYYLSSYKAYSLSRRFSHPLLFMFACYVIVNHAYCRSGNFRVFKFSRISYFETFHEV